MDLDPDQQLAKDLSDHDLLEAMYDDSKNDLPKKPVARTGSRIRSGSGTFSSIPPLTPGVGMSGSGGTISIDPIAVPAATLSQVEVDKLRKLMEEMSSESLQNAYDGSGIINVVHDSIIMEVPVKRPKPVVDAPKTIKALMKRPALAWAVLQGLKDAKVAGPWEEHKNAINHRCIRPHPASSDDAIVAGVLMEPDGKWSLNVSSRGVYAPFNDMQSAMNEADRVLTEDGWVLA